MALQTIMSRTVQKQWQIRWLETIWMFHFDNIHIEGKENILADALSRIYEGVSGEGLTESDYVHEEEKTLNTDGILPEEPINIITANPMNTASVPNSPITQALSYFPPIFRRYPDPRATIHPNLQREDTILQEDKTNAPMEVSSLINPTDWQQPVDGPILQGLQHCIM